MAENFSFRSSMNGFNRNEVIAYIDTLMKEKAELESRVSELENKVQELDSDNKTLREIIVDESKKNEEENSNKCEECDIAKVYEARLGAAMLDAKRFSEILVKEANDKAAGMFSRAYESAEDTGTKAKAISENIVNINKQFNEAFRALLENMKNLGESLDEFKADVKDTGSVFTYNTDFAPSECLSEEESSIIRKKSIRDVNFDDADDFEIRVDV